MALDCDVTFNGFPRDCENSVGGIVALYFIDRNDITSITFDTENTCLITGLTLAEDAAFAKFGIQPQTSNFETATSNDVTTGTTPFETTLTAVFKRMTAEKNCELQKFSSGTAVAMAKDANRNYWLIGVDGNDDDYALEWGDSTSGTGTARTDLNGYTIALVHSTYHYPYQVAQSVIDTLFGTNSAQSSTAKVSAKAKTTVTAS